MNKNQIFKIYGTEYKEMTKEILEKSDLVSLISSKESVIGIKPNMVVPCPAVMGATTHPEVVAGIIEYLREKGYKNLLITEGVWIGESTEECFEYTGFKSLCEEYDIPFVDIRKRGSHMVDCAGMDLKISDIVDEIDFLINVPVLKGHCQLKMTCALKNVKGLVPDDEKRRFHALGINEPLGHLGVGIHQDFIVIDNICGDPNFEDGGNPVSRNCIMTALDPVLVDSYVRKMFKLKKEDVPYIEISESCNIGCADLSKADIVSLNESNCSEFIEAAQLLDVAYAAESLNTCSACYSNLIPALLRLKEEGLLDKIDTKISIGQNHRGKCGKIGVGQCTKNFEHFIPGCPPSKDDIYNGLKEYILQS